MSHISTVKIEFTDQDVIKLAAKRMGLTTKEGISFQKCERFTAIQTILFQSRAFVLP